MSVLSCISMRGGCVFCMQLHPISIFAESSLSNLSHTHTHTHTHQGGKTCVKRVAAATSKLKTQIQRWRNNNPTQEEESTEQSASKALSEVQAELDETAESSKKLEDEFEDDAEGKAHRAKAENSWERLQDKVRVRSLGTSSR